MKNIQDDGCRKLNMVEEILLEEGIEEDECGQAYLQHSCL
jgi:hypothetical protein